MANVKYEDIYLKGYATIAELTLSLTEYFAFYNGERSHQALGYQTPDQVYVAKVGGGDVFRITSASVDRPRS